MKKNFKEKISFFKKFKKYNVSIWENPQFIFFVMGIIIVASILVIYLIGNKYLVEPEAIFILLFLITVVLLAISFAISRSFERLSEANRTKGELIRIVSHHLNTPLTSLRWIHDTFTYAKDNLNDKQIENLSIMKQNIDELIKMTGNLLIASRIENKKLLIVNQEFSLNELVYEIINKRKSSLSNVNNLDISFNEKEKDLLVLADPRQVEWVVKTLLDNAIKHSGCGKDKIKITVKVKKNNDKEALFEIQDNGVGISKKDQKYVFTKFFRSDNSVKYNIQGTGLGLFSCKLIIEKMKGKLDFKSEENVGTTFWFTLPLNKIIK